MAPQEFVEALQGAGQLPALVGEIARNKALASVLGKVKVVDSNGKPVDLSEFIGDVDEAEAEETPAEEKPAKKPAAKKAPAKKAADKADDAEKKPAAKKAPAKKAAAKKDEAEKAE